MSDTPPPTPLPSSKRGFGAPVVSTYSLTLMLAALAAAVWMKNDQMIIVLTSVIATNATSVVNFYVGSSASSQSKDDTISNQLPGSPPR